MLGPAEVTTAQKGRGEKRFSYSPPHKLFLNSSSGWIGFSYWALLGTNGIDVGQQIQSWVRILKRVPLQRMN